MRRLLEKTKRLGCLIGCNSNSGLLCTLLGVFPTFGGDFLLTCIATGLELISGLITNISTEAC